MTKDDIIRMAKEAGLGSTHTYKNKETYSLKTIDNLEAFANLVAAAEREACAKVCDDKHDTWRWDDESDSASGPRDCAAAIRARGNT
jgi:hypothetical protein